MLGTRLDLTVLEYQNSESLRRINEIAYKSEHCGRRDSLIASPSNRGN
jgi:hypothetical protein